MLIKSLINLFIYFQNFFKGKYYRCQKIIRVYFVFDQHYDRVIRDYYEYVDSLLAKNLALIGVPCLVSLDCNGFSWLKIFLPVKKIVFQIEHTLVKRGGRDCEGGISGQISIPDGSGKYLVRLANISKLQNADLIIEYSQINQFNIRQSPDFSAYVKKTFCIVPALYPLLDSSLGYSNERSFNTITMFGNPEESRRKQFLAALAKLNVNSENINGVFDGIESLYRNTRILINIRQTDHHDTLEELRVLPALRCGVIVISERAPLIEKTRYSQYIIWGELDELPTLIMEVQKNYDLWHKKIFESPGFIRRMNRISRCNELVALRVIRHLNT